MDDSKFVVVFMLIFLVQLNEIDAGWNLGCYSDQANDREFAISAGDYKTTDTSPQECTSACARMTYTYAAIQRVPQGLVCLCSSTKNKVTLVSDASCNAACSTNVCSGPVYIRIYSTANSIEGLSITSPSEGYVFDEIAFKVSIAKGDINSSFTFNFGDGFFVLSACANSTHKYMRTGTFNVKVGARNNQSGPIYATRTITIKCQMGQTDMACPDQIQEAGNTTKVSVWAAQGTGLSGEWIREGSGSWTGFNFPDALMYDVGSRATFGNISGSPQASGVYVMVTASFPRGGYIAAWELNAAKKGEVRLQVFRPTCPSGKTYCAHSKSCISPGSNCSNVGQLTCPGMGRICVSTGHCLDGCLSQNNTYPDSSTPLVDYTLVHDIIYNIATLGYQLVNLTKLVQVMPGDTIGWTGKNNGDLAFEHTTQDPEYYFTNANVVPGAVLTSSDGSRQDIKHVLRAHLSQTVWATSDYVFNTAGVHDVSVIVRGHLPALKKCNVTVQERISDLRITEPKCYIEKVSYPANEDIKLEKTLGKGSDVTYHWSSNSNGSVVTKSSIGDDVVRITSPGLHQVTLYAYNNISAMGVTSIFSVLTAVGTITLLSPVSALDIDIPGNYTFNLSQGGNVTVRVEIEGVEVYESYYEEANNTVFNVSHRFKRGGSRPIVVTADNDIAGEKTLTVYQYVKGKLGQITIEVKPEQTSNNVLQISTNQHYELYISSSMSIPINYTINAGSEGTEFKPTTLGKTVVKKHYKEPYQGNITVTAEANGESYDFNISVYITRCGPPAIYFPVENSINNKYTFTRGNLVTLQARAVYTKNPGCDSGDLQYDWTINEMEGSPDVDLSNFDLRASSFKINPRSLRQGNYSVNLTVTHSTRNLKYLYKTYLDVRQSQLLARILGGNPRDVPFIPDGFLELDGQGSLDPDDYSSTLSYAWMCRRYNDSTTDALYAGKPPSADLSCYSDSLTSIRGNGGNIRVPFSGLFETATYEFELTVSRDTRQSITRQLIRIVPAESPAIVIECRSNCKNKVNYQDKLTLNANCEKCSTISDLKPTWVLLNASKQRDSLDGNTSVTSTGFDKMGIAINANSLRENTEYYLKLTVTRRQQNVTVEYHFETTSPPRDGNCNALPTEGIAAQDEFVVDCTDWRTEDYPMAFEFNYETLRKDEAEINSLPQEVKISNLWYYGSFRKTPASVLPIGNEKEDYHMKLVVKIYNFYGAYTTFQLNITVKQPEVQVKVVEELKKQINQQTIQASQDPQQALQIVVSVASILNIQSKSNSEAGGKTDAQVKENTKLRSKCVDIAVSLPANDLTEVTQVTNAVTEAIADENEVTSETQIKASGFLSKASKVVRSQARKRGYQAESAVKIEETAQGIFTGVSHCLKASSKTTEMYLQLVVENLKKTNEIPSRNWDVRITERNANQNKEDAKVTVPNVFDAMDSLSGALQSQKLPSENTTTVSTKTFKIQLQKKQLNKLSSISIGMGSDEQSAYFDLPNVLESEPGDGGEECIDFQATTFNKNPLTWDPINSPNMADGVVGLELRKGDNAVKVENLKKYIDITIPIVAPKSLQKFNDTFSGSKIKSHHYSITNKYALESPLIIHVKPAGPLILYVAFGSQANASSNNLTIDLPCLNSSLPKPFIRVDDYTVLIMDMDFFGKSKSDVYLGLQAKDLDQEAQIPGSGGDSSVGVTSSFFITYEIALRSVGCRFWSAKNTEKWSSEGCTVSNKTTLTTTHCKCNHLTFFGSFVVAPNPIGPLTAEDFKRGYVLFVFVTVIYLIYFLAVLWARRKDRADVVKVGVCPLPDNDPTDQFRYEITLWTSMRRGAGTTSKVYLIMYGEEQETETRTLEDPERPPFQRGCVNTFLLTTSSNLGPLPYIRIWHDNSGGSWLLSRVMVIDLQNDDRYYFICNRWLAVDEDDGQVERLIPLASREELTEFQHLFAARTRRNLSDSHLWFSVVARPANSRFTRVQRVSCCLCLMMMSMMTSAMWYDRADEPKEGTSNNFAGFIFTWDQVFIGVCSSLIVFPVNLILVQMFRSVRPKPQRIRHKKSPNLPRLSLTVQNLTSYNRMKETSEDSKGSNNSIDSTQDKNARLRLSINDVHTDVDRVSFTSSPLLIDNRRRSTLWDNDGSRFRRFIIWLKKYNSLPYYFVYVAWVLVFIFSTTGAIVVILYGMRFKNKMSLQWLSSSIISFLQDVLITQPLKVLLTAVFFAMVIKKPDKAEFEVPSEAAQLAEDDDWLYSVANNNRKSGKGKIKILPPDQAKLIIMRRARMKERKMYSVIREVGFFYFFVCLVLMIAYTHRDYMAYVQTKEFKDMFSNQFAKIQQDPEFWNWTQKDLLVNLFPTKWYNGQPIPPNGFLSDHNSQMVGGARLRLIRVKEGLCDVPKDISFVSQECYDEFTIGDEDERDYLPGWTNVTNYSKPISRKDISWRFQTWQQLDGYPFMANVSTYPGSGYVLVLEPGMTNDENLQKLETLRWLDRKTRAIITEFTTYNAQTNLFTIVTLAAEFPATGGIIPFVSVQTARLYDFTQDIMYFVLTLEFVFVLFILFFTYKELKLLWKQGWKHFKEFWNVVEFVINVSAFVGIGLYIYRMLTIKDVVTRSRQKPFNFMSFQFAGYWDETYTFIIAILVMFTTIKLNKLLRFNKRMSLLSSTLKQAAFPLAMFGLIIGIIFLAFTLISTVVFGNDLQGYRSSTKSFTSLLSLMLGKASFLGMYGSNRVLGPLVFFMFMFLVSMVLINMFLSIVIDAFHVVRRDIAKQSNEYEIVDFIIDRFKLWAGIGKVRRPRRTQRRVLWNVAASKVKAIQAINNSTISLVSGGLCSDQVSELENRLEKLIKRTDLLYNEIFPEKRHNAKGKAQKKTAII